MKTREEIELIHRMAHFTAKPNFSEQSININLISNLFQILGERARAAEFLLSQRDPDSQQAKELEQLIEYNNNLLKKLIAIP